MSTELSFTKGHGTGNDFVIVSDPDGALDLSANLVRALCDRHFGIGGDGVLRVVRTERATQAPDFSVVAESGGPEWFMDYRNADGSLAQMCGNGIRVFARFLVDRGLARPGRMDIGTRGGIRVVHVPPGGDISVDMGAPDDSFPDRVRVLLAGRTYEAHGLGMPNPHAVVTMDSLAVLPEQLPEPQVDEVDFPEGVNVEFVEVLEEGRAIRMRVYERGAAETMSCGTGACAAAVVMARRWGLRAEEPIRVEVAGGSLDISLVPGGSVRMSGPAELVADGRMSAAWLDEATDGVGL